jgi:2',3'-cyclic-nucleotide 2'-phosphodiesterase/3'-nucleotidase
MSADPGWSTPVPDSRPASAPSPSGGSFRLTILGTTDLHGHVLNWDYFSDSPFGDTQGNQVGLAKIATLVAAERARAAERDTGAVLVVDAGDTIQGTPLAYYHARIAPIGVTRAHPVAIAMNAIGFDAAALGNHEFNYGIELLRAWESQLDFPLLGANARDAGSGEAAFGDYVIRTLPTPHGPLRVGIVGLVTPGCAIWDRAHVAGVVDFGGIVEWGRIVVPQVRAAGADVVVVLAHSGMETSSSYGATLPWPENESARLAEQVPGIDAVLVGHAHVEVAERFVRNLETGRDVLLSEPLKWGMRLTVMELDLAPLDPAAGGGWQVVGAHAELRDARDAPEDPIVAGRVAQAHADVRRYVNGVIGRSDHAMSAATARYEHTEVIEFINRVQASAARAELAGTDAADLPVLGVAAPFNADAGIPAGEVSVRDVAALYNFDNTLHAVRLTGRQLREYLEYSARYFHRVESAGPFRPERLTNAPRDNAPRGVADYNYDIVSGLDAPLCYDIDLANEVGDRIARLTYDGSPVGDDQLFVVAVNNYRASGGGNFPVMASAPVLLASPLEIRQLLIDRVAERGAVDDSGLGERTWRLVFRGMPITVGTGGTSTEPDRP